MTLHESITFNISSGLQSEIDHVKNEQNIVYTSVENLKQATQNSLYEAAARELIAHLPPNSKVVDLGCGFGETSLILALAGHEVHSVEPALNRCKALTLSLKNLALPGNTYVCTAEEVNKIPLKNVNGALFCSSLHHCDHPLQALESVKTILAPKGVIVIHEPILRFYRTKQWYYQQLVKNPVKMGHYGGNEHIYYFKEYYNMLKSIGCVHIEFHWATRNVDPRKTLMSNLSGIIQGKYQHSIVRCMVKYCIHASLKKMNAHTLLNSLFLKPLMRMSLIQASFVGYLP